MWFHLLQLWTLIAFHSFAHSLSHSHSHSQFYFRTLGSLCANQLHTTKSTNIQTHTRTHRSADALACSGPIALFICAIKLETLYYVSMFMADFCSPIKLAEREKQQKKSQACHKFNKISNEKCYFKNRNFETKVRREGVELQPNKPNRMEKWQSIPTRNMVL